MEAAPRSLIARAKLGDSDAFAELVRHYYPRCLRFALNMLGNREDAEEAVQDAWLRVHSALPRYQEFGRFESWLFRILANQCRTVGARTRRHGQWLELTDDDLEEPIDIDPLQGQDWREEITLALDELPVQQREAFLLHHVEGMSYEEMATITSAGISALKMRVKRAVDFLRVRLREVQSA